MKKLGRAILIGMLAAAIAATAVLFRFAVTPQVAEADVWQRFRGVIREVPRFLHANEGSGDVHEVEINGNTLFYTNTMTNRSAREVTEYYERLYRRPELHVLTENVRADPKFVARGEVLRVAEAVDELLNARFSRVFRQDGDGFGIVGYLDMGNVDFVDHYVAHYRAYRDSGGLDDLGVGKAVLAIEEGPGKTTVLNFWTGPGFNMKRFSGGARDAEGEDIDDVPRMNGAVRILSTRETDPLAKVRLVVYRVPASPRTTLFHYLGALRDEGWTQDPVYQNADASVGENRGMVFGKRGRELTLSVGGEENGNAMVVAIERQIEG